MMRCPMIKTVEIPQASNDFISPLHYHITILFG
jgi:hypothetical protein